CAVGLADVRVQIDPYHATSLPQPAARASARARGEPFGKTKGHHDTWCPPASPAWLPQHSRRPAVIRPATCAVISQAVCPRNYSKVGAFQQTVGVYAHDFVVRVTVLSFSSRFLSSA